MRGSNGKSSKRGKISPGSTGEDDTKQEEIDVIEIEDDVE